jgi:hypothetical protein
LCCLDNSNPVAWEVGITGETINDLKSVEELLRNAKRLFYIPPESSLAATDSALCKFGSIGTCQAKYWKTYATLLYKCQQFISYVTVGLDITYNNRYCKFCHEFTEQELQVMAGSGKNNYHLSLTRTLSEYSLRVTTHKS